MQSVRLENGKDKDGIRYQTELVDAAGTTSKYAHGCRGSLRQSRLRIEEQLGGTHESSRSGRFAAMCLFRDGAIEVRRRGSTTSAIPIGSVAGSAGSEFATRNLLKPTAPGGVIAKRCPDPR